MGKPEANRITFPQSGRTRRGACRMNRSIVVAEWHRALEALRAAETLTRDGLYADAISRAYYDILHSAKAALHVHEVGAESHSAVRRMFGLHPVGSGEIEPEWSAYLTVKSERDIFSLRNESLEESDNLPGPDVLAQEIVEDLEAALEQFREIASDLSGQVDQGQKS
jgi:uncharacterized protein (UPF0332 family)